MSRTAETAQPAAGTIRHSGTRGGGLQGGDPTRSERARRDGTRSDRLRPDPTQFRFKDLVERITDGVLMVDRNGSVLYANSAALAMLGYEDLVGRSVGLPLGLADTELELMTSSGVVRYAEMRVVATEWEGRPVWLALLRDITDRHEAEVELIRLNADLLRSNHDLETLASILAHDLKQPLAEVVGQLHLLARRLGEGGRTGPRLLREAISSLTGMGEFIDAMLHYSRPGATIVERTSVDCTAVVEHCVGGLGDLTGTVVIGSLPTVRTDQRLLQQIFQNLIGNGIKYGRPGVQPRVEVTAERGPDHWTLIVADNGAGIPDGVRAKIFEAHWRPPEEPRPGHGIGLAACRAAVERLGGRIWVEDGVTGGSRFCFTIPDA